METKTKSVSVVVPVYNGQETLRELAKRVQTVLDRAGYEHELIFVNDGSRDLSWQVIQDLALGDRRIRGLDLMRNYGQHNALFAGIMRSRHSFIVTIDDDLQHPPEEIPSLLCALEGGYDVAYGKPQTREHNVWRNAASRIVKSALRVVLGAEMGDYSSAFRAFRTELKNGFSDFSDPNLSIDVLLSWSARTVACIPVEHCARMAGRSGYSLRKLIGLTFSVITGYSTLPLRVASIVGLATAIGGLLLFLYLLIRRLFQDSAVPGFAFLASEIALFAGLQLFAIGILGEYLARMHFRTMGKPPYVIREDTEHHALSQ